LETLIDENNQLVLRSSCCL